MNYINLTIQIVLIIFLVCICIWLYKLNSITTLIKRISNFSAISKNDISVSYFDKLEVIYNNLVTSFTKILSKSKLISNYCYRKYDVYVDQTSRNKINNVDYLSNRIIICVIALAITIISNVLRTKNTTFFQLFITLIVGFNITEVFLYIRKKQRNRRIEDDLLKAVTIMNNAFKSGKSIMQSIELVGSELTGPISDEYKKMYIDLSYGLDLEVVFNRFAKRVQLEEVKYMSSSLVILNKTGGNLVKIFASIEKGFFDRKKLRNELKSSTALSDAVFRILVVTPFVLFLMIYIFNNSYFNPFVETTIGKILLFIILTIYVLYIRTVLKVINIKE